jgi:hypothetical protein
VAYLVTSLVNLRAEIDAMWPNRDRRTDGWLADPKVRTSYGHNPDGKGAVHAIDIDKDGIWPPYILDRIKQVKGVIWYAIWDRHIYSDDYGWAQQPYGGPNPHTDHVHIEVRHTATGENYQGVWGLLTAPTQTFGSAPYTDPQWGEADPSAAMAAVSGYFIAGGQVHEDGARAIAGLRNL